MATKYYATYSFFYLFSFWNLDLYKLLAMVILLRLWTLDSKQFIRNVFMLLSTREIDNVYISEVLYMCMFLSISFWESYGHPNTRDSKG